MADVADKPRDKWGSKVEFVVSCIGLSVGLGNIWRFPYLVYTNGGAKLWFFCIGLFVGLGNIWRFPYLVYTNGGGAFLVPYVIILTFIGRPMYYMELILGQFCGFGVLKSFRGMPLATGVAWGMIFVCFGISLYYNVIIAYILDYIYFSLFTVLPWSYCDPEWANNNCYVRKEGVVPCNAVNKTLFNSFGTKNSTETDAVLLTHEKNVFTVPRDTYYVLLHNCTNATDPATQQFFRNRLLGLSSGVEDLGGFKVEVLIALLLAWTCIAAAVCKGIKSSGKVVLFTSFIPFFTLGALLIRGLTLEGAGTGLYYYLVPEWKKILEPKVWQKAAEQVFFSLSVAQGMIYSLGSYNDFRNSLVRDVYIIAFADLLVSFVAGMVVFSVLGHMAHNLNVAVADVVDAGFGLAFVVYPESVTLLTWPNFWSLAFFVMLFFLALASEVSLVEGVLTPIKDEFPACQRHPTRLAFTFCAVYFFLCLPMATKGGMYVLNFLDTYIGGVLLFLLALCEAVSLSLVYGVNRFALDCEFMMESPPGNLIKLCWKFLCPIALVIIFAAGASSYERLTFGTYVYPSWISILAVVMVAVVFQMIPSLALRHFIRSGKNFRQALKPLDTWGPKDPELRLKYDAFMAERGYGPQSGEKEPAVGSAEKPSPGLSETPESPVQNVGEVQPKIEPPASETGK